MRLAAIRADRDLAPLRDILAEGWREALEREAAGTAVQDNALLAGLARFAAEQRDSGRRSADEPLLQQAVAGVLHCDAAAADVLACLVAIKRCAAGWRFKPCANLEFLSVTRCPLL